MLQSQIKADVCSAGWFAEVVINTVGEVVKKTEKEGETDKAEEMEGKRETEMETAERFGTVSVILQERNHFYKNIRL